MQLKGFHETNLINAQEKMNSLIETSFIYKLTEIFLQFLRQFSVVSKGTACETKIFGSLPQCAIIGALSNLLFAV